MPAPTDLIRTVAYWLASIASSVAIVAASAVFMAHATSRFLTPSATAQFAERQSAREPASVSPEPVADPVPAIINGPPPAVHTVALAAPAAVAVETSPKVVPDVASTRRIAASSGVNVRSEPRNGSAKVGTLAGGTGVTVLGEQGAWTHIATAEVEGWVFTKYLAHD